MESKVFAKMTHLQYLSQINKQCQMVMSYFLSAKHFYVSDFPRERPYLLALGLLQILRILLL